MGLLTLCWGLSLVACMMGALMNQLTIVLGGLGWVIGFSLIILSIVIKEQTDRLIKLLKKEE